jgi:hypothetical protein
MGRPRSHGTILLFAIIILAFCVLASAMMLEKAGMPPDAAQGVVSSVAATANRAIGEIAPVMVRQLFLWRVMQVSLTLSPS